MSDASRPMAATEQGRRTQAMVIAAAVVFANLIILFAGMFVFLGSSEALENVSLEAVWAPVMTLAIGQLFLSGLLLAGWRPTRQVGKGLLAGTLSFLVAIIVVVIAVSNASFA